MKKGFFILVVLTLLAIFVGCGGKDTPVKNINLYTDLLDVKVGINQSATVVATVTGTEDAVTWTSADSTIATVVNGVITGVGEGTTVITVSVGDKSVDINVTVTVTKFKVVFLDEDGNELSKTNVIQGTAAREPSHPEKAGFVFVGWDHEFDNVQSDLTIRPVYRKVFAVTYDLDGGNLFDTSLVTRFADEDFTLPEAYKVGTAFKGWTLTKDGTNYIKKISKDIEGDITVYAHFEAAVKFNVTYDFAGGSSNELYLANKESAISTINITAFNSSPTGFWGGYPNYIYMFEKKVDEGVTFSDRIYVGIDKETGLYQIMGIIDAGQTSWPNGATHVITISNSYNAFHSVHNSSVAQLKVGMIAVFDTTNFKTAISQNKGFNVYFFDSLPENQTIQATQNVNTAFATPTRLGFDFMGWMDKAGNQITSGSQLYQNIELTAQWKEKNPVTSIQLNDISNEIVTGKTFQIVAKVVPANAYFKTVYYETSDPDILSVDEYGLLKGVNKGSATLTIHDFMNKVVITKEITVYSVDSIDITFDDNYDGVLKVGETYKFEPKAVGKDITGLTFSYASSDSTVVSVSNDGTITALKEGSAIITITDNASVTHTLEVGVVVNNLSGTSTIDEIIKLFAENNFAVVHAGNVSLYDDGRNRYYAPTTGSVNRFLFDDLVVNTKYVQQAIEKAGKTLRSSLSFETPIEFVCVHDTATLSGSVEGIASYMSSGDVSIHYTVGDDKVYQVVPENMIAWHAGDGTGAEFTWTKTNVSASSNVAPEFDVSSDGYLMLNGIKSNIKLPKINGKEPAKQYLTHLGPTWKVADGFYWIGTIWASGSYDRISSHGGNNNSIGIEMNVNTNDNDIYDTWQRTAKLVADILIRNNLDTTRVKQHNTFSGKNCPQCLIAGGYWDYFMEMVEMEYLMQTKYKDAKITMVSNNPNIVDKTGRVIKAPSVTTTVSYTVTVELNGQTKSITLYSVVPGTTTWEQWSGLYPANRIWNEGKYGRLE